MYMDQDLRMRQQDFVVCVVCDGYDGIPASFKKFARKNKIFDERILQERGFMEREYMGDDRLGKWKMKTMRDLCDPELKDDQIPKNCLHLFQVCTWDFGLERDYLSGRRINFVFALK